MTELENAIWAVVEQLEIMNISKKKSVSKNEHTEEVRGLIEALKFYAEEHHFKQHEYNGEDVVLEYGETARQALKPFEKEEANDRPD